ncbi:N-terminal domain of reverse transcriptase family protein [Rickettsia hoogstraalii str. RCCE3]|nr:N-terminal domain of reverse transcriptase family protein [Rickettsia hoogstraalii str. RCCE3]
MEKLDAKRKCNIKTNDNNNSEQIHWYTIDWQDINKKVNNLRKRIYRASANGNTKLVGSLQKLM